MTEGEGYAAEEREKERGGEKREGEWEGGVSGRINLFHMGVKQNKARLHCTYGNVTHKVWP